MRILLIGLPSITELFSPGFMPIGLGYIASCLRDRHQVKLLDMEVDRLSRRQFMDCIKRFDPDVAGFSASTPIFYEAEQLAGLVKEVKRDVKVAFGGPHATAVPEETLNSGNVDYVIVGEGEETIRELMDAMERGDEPAGVKGVGYKRNGRTILTGPRPFIENLDAIPFPSYDLMSCEKYRKSKSGFCAAITRGCPHGCIFCASFLSFGKRIRKRSVGNVIEELTILKEKHGMKWLSFHSDTFTSDRNYTIELCREMIARRLNLYWECETRVDKVDEELLGLMREAGCRDIGFGIESGSQRILDFMKKRITLEQAKRAAEMTRKAGIIVRGFFIINFPGETREEMNRTVRFADEIGIQIFRLTTATPYPGTELYNICSESKIVDQDVLRDYSNYAYLDRAMINNSDLNRDEIIGILRESRLRMRLKFRGLRLRLKLLFQIGIIPYYLLPLLWRELGYFRNVIFGINRKKGILKP